MVTQRNSRYGDFSGSNTYFIIGDSWNSVYDELSEFINQHGTEHNTIWVYEEPIRPSKINLRPEYSLEVNIRDKDDMILMCWSRRVW